MTVCRNQISIATDMTAGIRSTERLTGSRNQVNGGDWQHVYHEYLIIVKDGVAIINDSQDDDSEWDRQAAGMITALNLARTMSAVGLPGCQDNVSSRSVSLP